MIWAFLLRFGALLARVPLKAWLFAGGVAFILGAHLHLVHKAVAANDAKWEKKEADARTAYDKQVADIRAQQQQVITRTVIEYRDRVQIVKEKGDEVVREVEKLVPHTVGMLPGGMRVIHDAAATGDLPDDPERAADTAAPVDASTLAATVAANYEGCRETAAELVALQQLITQTPGFSVSKGGAVAPPAPGAGLD